MLSVIDDDEAGAMTRRAGQSRDGERGGELPGLDVAGLTRWLRGAHPALAGDALTARVIAGGRSNLTYAVDGATLPLIVRRPPLGHVLSSAHDMRREHRVISALATSPVPVPRAVDVVDDSADGTVTGTVFFVMERAPGVVLARRSQNADFTAAGLRRLSLDLVRHLADLHALEPARVGLGDWAGAVADAAGTIGYEVLTSLGPRYERVYKGAPPP